MVAYIMSLLEIEWDIILGDKTDYEHVAKVLTYYVDLEPLA
jgi:hypothetical protein